jgi:hypothetical protein
MAFTLSVDIDRFGVVGAGGLLVIDNFIVMRSAECERNLAE